MVNDLKAYVIDTYHPLRKVPGVKLIFKYNEIEYCIRETELEWGQPIHSNLVDDEDEYSFYQVYSTYEEALDFVKGLKKIK